MENNNIDIFNKPEIFLNILEYLSPSEKRECALVSKLWQINAEDPLLLLKDLKANKSLSIRQLSIIFSREDYPKDVLHRVALEILKMTSYESPGCISVKNALRILDLFTSCKVPTHMSFEADYTWVEHDSRIHLLARSVEQSSDFLENKTTIIAAFANHFKALTAYQGFDINGILTAQNRTPLGFAVEQRQIIVIEALLQAGAEVDRRSDDWGKRTPLFNVVISSKVSQQRTNECIELLIRERADPNATTIPFGDDEISHNRRKTTLWYAAHFGEEETVKTLVRLGADINFQTNHLFGDSTPIQAAAYEGKLETVKALVELGADPLLENERGETALAVAQRNKRPEIVRYLQSLSTVDAMDCD